MKKVEVIQNFSGYPDGKKRVDYVTDTGRNIVDVPDDFADLIVKKGHAKFAPMKLEEPKQKDK